MLSKHLTCSWQPCSRRPPSVHCIRTHCRTCVKACIHVSASVEVCMHPKKLDSSTVSIRICITHKARSRLQQISFSGRSELIVIAVHFVCMPAHSYNIKLLQSRKMHCISSCALPGVDLHHLAINDLWWWVEKKGRRALHTFLT